MHKMIKVGLLSFLVSMAASATTFNFTNTDGSFTGSNAGGVCNPVNGGYCAAGDTFSQSLEGVNLTATAWNSTSPSSAFSAAELFKSGSSPSFVGLGVCNSFEGIHTTGASNCTNSEGYLDNSGSLDLILFVFNTPMDPTQITLNATIHAGTDTQWWFSNLTTLAGQSLDSLGAPSGTSGSTTINLSGVQNVQSIIFAANQNQSNDGVKVTSLSVTAVPEPATYGMMGVALVIVGWLRRHRNF